jgi:DNA-binding SARP family transcriptional activator
VIANTFDFAALASEFARLSKLCSGIAGLDDRHPDLVERARTLAAEFEDVLVTQPSSSSAALPVVEIDDIRINSFGVFQIVIAGQVLPPCHASRAVMVLRYLLTKPRWETTKDDLIEAIWGETGGTNPRHSLHVAVSSLRQHLGCSQEQVVRFQAGRYGLAQFSGITHDVTLFDESVAAGATAFRCGDWGSAQQQYERATALYGGDFCLHHLAQPWAIGERERLIIQYHSALQRLGEIGLRRGDCEAAVKYFHLLAERDPFREDVHLSLMISYVMLDRVREAVRQYETCRIALKDELGIEPNSKLRHLYGSILASEIDGAIDPKAWL